MSLLVAQHIRSVLSANTALSAKIEDRMFPIATLTETKFPFVVYERESIAPRETKDGYDDETTMVAVYAFSDSYSESLEVAQMCRKALNGSTGYYDDFDVNNCLFVNADEAYASNTFAQKLIFEIKTEEK